MYKRMTIIPDADCRAALAAQSVTVAEAESPCPPGSLSRTTAQNSGSAIRSHSGGPR
jgi:hypothetical protein